MTNKGNQNKGGDRVLKFRNESEDMLNRMYLSKHDQSADWWRMVVNGTGWMANVLTP